MKQLKNRYYAFRHGQSRANAEEIIISDPAVGTVDYGLTDEGRRQVEQGAASVAGLGSDALIYSSDFLRAVETAEIIRALLGVAAVEVDTRLRERFFGEWDGKPHSFYPEAWKKDAFDPDREYGGAESSRGVQERMWSVIESLEERFEGRDIILVSHGDPIMLLQTAFMQLCPGSHRSLPYIETAGCRLLNP